MPVQERCRPRNGEPAMQSGGLPGVALRRESRKLSFSGRKGSEVPGDLAVATFGDRGAQGGEGTRPRIVGTRRRPSQVCVNGTRDDSVPASTQPSGRLEHAIVGMASIRVDVYLPMVFI